MKLQHYGIEPTYVEIQVNKGETVHWPAFAPHEVPFTFRTRIAETGAADEI